MYVRKTEGKKRVVDRRFPEIEHLCFTSIDKIFGEHKKLADNGLQNFFAKIRSEVDQPCSE